MRATPSWTFVGLGGNLGGEAAVRARIEQAMNAIAALPYVTVVERSNLYRSAPVGPVADQPEFLNAVLGFPPPAAEPAQLLADLLSIERALGRDRSGAIAKGPRVIDLDLLLMGERRCAEPGLVLPHPRLRERRFVLDPLAELLGPDAELPAGLGRLRDLRAQVSDQPVTPISK